LKKVNNLKKTNNLKNELIIAKKEIHNCETFEDLKKWKSRFLNKSQTINDLKKLRNEIVHGDLKSKANIVFVRKISIILDNYTYEINQLFEEKRISLDSDLKENNLDYVADYHLLNKIMKKSRDFFLKNNFIEIYAFELEDEFHNFDGLNIPIDHPARKTQDTFFLETNNSNRKLLRTHATNMSFRHLEKNFEKPSNSFSMGTVFRNDDDDLIHSHQFMQIDIVSVGENISVSNLKWIIENYIKYIFDNDIKIRFRSSYFPFTEPSFEVDIFCIYCENKKQNEKCRICHNEKWIEILGCGMLHPNVFAKAWNIDVKKVEFKGFAVGIGIERIAMLYWGKDKNNPINDIRIFYENRNEKIKNKNI